MRLDPFGRWKPGMKIHCATGSRTKQYTCFAEKICTGIQNVRFSKQLLSALPEPNLFFFVSVDGIGLYYNQVKLLYTNDGFGDLYSFVDFFFKKDE
jgi:hypothetical protein